jgi:CheY-like chemotaxis protein
MAVLSAAQLPLAPLLVENYETPGGTASMASELHILVVDDRPDTVLFMTEFLLSRRHRVVTSSNGTEALEAILRRQRTNEMYDLVISDVTMPGMDGLSLVRELRRRQVNVPVVLYTAYGSMHPNLNQLASQNGCIAVLDKPIELRRIELLIDDVLVRRNGSQRQEKDQPFFGTSRVARPATNTIRRPSEHGEHQGTGALERKGGAPHPDTGAYHTIQPAPTPLPFDAEPGTNRLIHSLRTPLPFTPEPQTNSVARPLGTPPPIRAPHTSRTPQPDPHEPQTHPVARGLPPPLRTPLPFAVDPQTNPIARPIRTPLPVANPSPTTAPNPTTSFIRRSVEAPPVQKTGYVRRPSGLFLSKQDDAQTGTTRLRRSVTGTYSQPPVGAQPPAAPPSPPLPPPPPPTASHHPSRAVACAHCRKVFMVAARSGSYTSVCIHCGQLNRIDPL